MAEKETKNEPKDLIEAVPEELEKERDIEGTEILGDENSEVEEVYEEAVEESKPTDKESNEGIKRLNREEREKKEKEQALASWVPKTQLGLLVKTGKLKDIDDVLENHRKILEPEIVDYLIPVQSDLILIGQAKGKFGGGKRRAWRQTQKKTKEGNVMSFSSMAVVGDHKGHIGIGYGKAKETLPAREKAIRNAKLNLIKIEAGYELQESGEEKPHTVPFKVSGKCGSVRITLMPAPRGTGLVVADECKKLLRLAGIEDVYGNTQGKTKITFNLLRACFDALSKIREFER